MAVPAVPRATARRTGPTRRRRPARRATVTAAAARSRRSRTTGKARRARSSAISGRRTADAHVRAAASRVARDAVDAADVAAAGAEDDADASSTRRSSLPMTGAMIEPEPIRKTLLGSGLRLVTERLPALRSAAVGFWVGTGSRDEPDALAGAS